MVPWVSVVMCIFIYIYLQIYTYICINTHIHIYIYRCNQHDDQYDGIPRKLYSSTYVYIYICTYVYIRIHTYTYIDIINMMIDVTGYHGCQLSCHELGGSFAPATVGMMVSVILYVSLSLCHTSCQLAYITSL